MATELKIVEQSFPLMLFLRSLCSGLKCDHSNEAIKQHIRMVRHTAYCLSMCMKLKSVTLQIKVYLTTQVEPRASGEWFYCQVLKISWRHLYDQ